MIQPRHPNLSVVQAVWCRSADTASTTIARGERAQNLVLVTEIDRQFLDTPLYGAPTDDLAFTYIPLARRFMYLAAIIEWWGRKMMVWRLSNTMEAQFGLDALDEALRNYAKPEIFNPD